jgi:hypothetical protein
VAAAALGSTGSAGAVCSPAANGIFPASGIVGTSVTATISGTGLAGATLTVFGDAGLVATPQSGTDLALTVQLVLDAAALPGERIIIVETAGGSAGVSFTINPPGGPVVTATSPPLLATQGIPLEVTLSGADLAGVTSASFAITGAGVSVAAATPSADGLTLAVNFAIDAAADLGTHAVTLTTPLGSVVLQLYVQRPPPTLVSVSPGAGEVGATLPVTLTGMHLAGAALVVTGSGVTVSDVATPDDATLTATLAIEPGLAPNAEPRLLIVTTESGQTTIEFFVVAADVPTVTSIRPGAGEPGDTMTVTLRGLNLSAPVIVSTPSPDLLFGPAVLVDEETVTVDVSVIIGATTDTDHVLTVTTGAGVATATFRVIALGIPFIGAVRPPFGNRGSTITVLLDGVNLLSVVPGTGVQLSGPKITESNAAAVDDLTARATLEIDPTANVGFRDVTVTTGGGSFVRSAAFRVNVPGQLPSITDVSPSIVVPGTTTPITVTGTNFEGGAALVTGPGAVVTNVAVDPTGTIMTFDLTLAPDAPAENRAVIVVTEDGIARCGIASDAAAPALVASKLVKTGAVFAVPSTGFRLVVFEFSLNELFPTDLRTWTIAEPTGTLTLTRLDVVNVGRAFREHHRGFVRARGVTPTNRTGLSAPQVVRR